MVGIGKQAELAGLKIKEKKEESGEEKVQKQRKQMVLKRSILDERSNSHNEKEYIEKLKKIWINNNGNFYFAMHLTYLLSS